MHTTAHTRGRQQGSTLLEALVAILIFSLGILAIIGMQAASISASSEAKYRSDANLIVSGLLGRMQSGDPATLAAAYIGSSGTGGVEYTAWLPKVQAALPGASDFPPTVTVDGTGRVSITVFWRAPGDSSPTAHNYAVVTQIR